MIPIIKKPEVKLTKLNILVIGISIGVVLGILLGIKEPIKEPTQEIKSSEQVETIAKSSWVGKASYYSREGCVGCHPDLIMANGEPLNDNAFTVAFNDLPLGSFVTVKNLKNDQFVTAQVTDTGGFNELGRIIDLTIAVRDAIDCNDLCDVEVTEL